MGLKWFVVQLVEIYSMGSIALRAQIDWNLSPTAVYVLNSMNNNIPITTGFVFY